MAEHSFSDGNTGDEGAELDGKGLRAKLEQEIAERRKAEGELRTYKVKDFLAEKGLTLVKPEDLGDVALDKVEERALAIQAERQQLKESLVRDIFSSQGIDGDDLEAAVKEFIGQRSAESEEAEATQRVRSLQSKDSKPTPLVNPENVHGYDAIRAAEEQTAREQRR